MKAWNITFNGEHIVKPALLIPDGDDNGVTSTINFVQTGLIADVKVRVNIEHTHSGYLIVTLIAPDETNIILHDDTGNTNNDIITEYPDLTIPNQTLSNLIGKKINGAWKLKVQDQVLGNIGTLNSWTLWFSAQ